MELDLLLFELCQEFICILKELREQLVITEEEYKTHTILKNKFIKTYIDKNIDINKLQ